jgi:hypothetical protein
MRLGGARRAGLTLCYITFSMLHLGLAEEIISR